MSGNFFVPGYTNVSRKIGRVNKVTNKFEHFKIRLKEPFTVNAAVDKVGCTELVPLTISTLALQNTCAYNVIYFCSLNAFCVIFVLYESLIYSFTLR